MNNLRNEIDPNFGYETREDYEKAVKNHEYKEIIYIRRSI
jgi:hypothetical protein